jgi:predicted O-methyltransferase YrrM
MTADEVIHACEHIPSSVHEPEQRMWWERLKDLPGHPVIVDFGTGHGKSAASLALSCPQGHVYTCDPGEPYINDGCSPEQYVIETEKFMADSGATNITFTRESSLEIAWDKPIDVLNIDSSHSYEQTLAEIRRWFPFVKQGGHIFFHDYEHPREPGIRKAIDELIPSQFPCQLIEISGPIDNGVRCAHYIKE